jgi:hypothetical protein
LLSLIDPIINMGRLIITLLIFLVFCVASSAFSDYPPKNPQMISGNQLDSLSLPHSRTGESMLSEPAPPLLVGGKCDEGAGLGFLEQTMSPWTAIAADGGSVGSGGNGWRGRSGDRNFGAAKKVLRGLVITMLILLKIIRVRGFRTSRKETRAIANLEQSSEMYREQHGVDESKGGGEGVGLQREYRSSQDTVSFEGKGGDSDTGRDGPKRFGESCFKLFSMIFTNLHLSPDFKDRLIIEATNCLFFFFFSPE